MILTKLILELKRFVRVRTIYIKKDRPIIRPEFDFVSKTYFLQEIARIIYKRTWAITILLI
jgi:hypothetical protein